MNGDEKAAKLLNLYEKIRNDGEYRTEAMGNVLVPGDGLLEGSPIVFIGEAPGREEEIGRKPFVGAAGRNLSVLLDGIGLSRQQVFMTNLVKYRPVTPDGRNRAPSRKETGRAFPYLLAELEIVEPCLAVCLGLSSAKALLEDPGLTMNEANGGLFDVRGLKVLVSYHPSPLNYGIPAKRAALREAFEELKAIRSGASPARPHF